MRTPDQIVRFKARLNTGLALVPMDMSRMMWAYRRDRWADNAELLPQAPEPQKKPVIILNEAKMVTRAEYEQLRGQVAFLQNKVTEMRAEKKKGGSKYS